MKVKEFKHYINRGLGKTIIFLKEHPKLTHKYYHAIFYACSHNTAYDPQCENSRVSYLYEIISLSNEKSLFENRIIEKLTKLQKLNWDTSQMLLLAKIFAENGNPQVRQVIYDKFLESLRGNEYVGSTEIIELDGKEGFIFIVNAVGERIMADKDYWEDDLLIKSAYEQFGEEETKNLLIEEAKSKPAVKVYLETVNHYLETNTNAKKQGHESYLEIKEKIANYKIGDHLFWLSIWGRKASQEEIEVAAFDLLKETNENKLIPYLALFYRRDFPFEINIIIEIAKSTNDKLASAALRILKRHQNEAIHDLAVELIKKGNVNPDVLELFEKNYIDSDINLIEKVFYNEYSEFDYHGIGLLLIHIFKNHKTAKCQKMMVELYNNGQCSSCRGWVIDILMDNDILPDWMAQESLYDSNLETRQRVSDYLNGVVIDNRN
jgi:hypothetical protein